MVAGLRRLLLALLVAVALSGAAAPERVDLNLVLAVDSSSSVDAEEFTLQMEALRMPSAILR